MLNNNELKLCTARFWKNLQEAHPQPKRPENQTIKKYCNQLF